MFLARPDLEEKWIDFNPDGLAERRGIRLRDTWDQELSLGKEVFLGSVGRVQTLDGKESVSIQSGEFALMLTEERVSLPFSHMAFISLRTKYKQQGLINVSGFHVDPGYAGHLVFAVYNAGPNPVAVRRWDGLFKILFAKMSKNIPGTRPKPILRLEAETFGMLEGPATNIQALKAEVDGLRTRLRWLLAAATTILVTIGTVVAERLL